MFKEFSLLSYVADSLPNALADLTAFTTTLSNNYEEHKV